MRQIEPKRKSLHNIVAAEEPVTKPFDEKMKEELGKIAPVNRRADDWRVGDERRVPVIEIKRTKRNFTGFYVDASNRYPNDKIIRNNDTGINIAVGSHGLKDTYAHAMTMHKIKSYSAVNASYQIEQIIENSILLDVDISEKNNRKKHTNTIFMDKFYGIYHYNNDFYLAKITIEQFLGKQTNEIERRFYNLQDIKIPEDIARQIKETSRNTVLGNESHTVTSLRNVYDVSVAELRAFVNTLDKNFFENKIDPRTGQLERQPLIDELASKEKSREIPREIMPDTTVAVEDVHSYGYTSEGMLPLSANIELQQETTEQPETTHGEDNVTVADENISPHGEDIQHTPLYADYLELTEQYPDKTVFIRVGDFYETFADNAVKTAEILNLTLVGRDIGAAERVPMVGVPAHRMEQYAKTLNDNGISVVVIDRDVSPVATQYTHTLYDADNKENENGEKSPHGEDLVVNPANASEPSVPDISFSLPQTSDAQELTAEHKDFWRQHIAHHLAANNGIMTIDDLQLSPFDNYGGLGKFYEVFGENTYKHDFAAIVAEENTKRTDIPWVVFNFCEGGEYRPDILREPSAMPFAQADMFIKEYEPKVREILKGNGYDKLDYTIYIKRADGEVYPVNARYDIGDSKKVCGLYNEYKAKTDFYYSNPDIYGWKDTIEQFNQDKELDYADIKILKNAVTAEYPYIEIEDVKSYPGGDTQNKQIFIPEEILSLVAADNKIKTEEKAIRDSNIKKYGRPGDGEEELSIAVYYKIPGDTEPSVHRFTYLLGDFDEEHSGLLKHIELGASYFNQCLKNGDYGNINARFGGKTEDDAKRFTAYYNTLREVLYEAAGIERLQIEKSQKNDEPVKESPHGEDNVTVADENKSPHGEDIQEKSIEYARRHAHLPLGERLNIIAQAFGVESASVYVTPCTGKYRGKSDICLRLKGGGSMGLGMRSNAAARKDSTISECVNNALAKYNPETVAETKARAATALKAREAIDNAIAEQLGLKPYKFLNVELSPGEEMGGHTGCYYVTIAVDNKIIGFVTSDLSSDIERGVLTDSVSRANYFVAGGLRDIDVDFVFNNVGHSSFGSSYTVEMSQAARERAEKTLARREQIEDNLVADFNNNNISQINESPHGEDNPQSQNFRITDDRLGEGSPKEKCARNIEAIRIIKDIDRRGYGATPEEQEKLSRYIGWGGLPQVFDDMNASFAAEYKELKSLLTEKEYESARASTLNAHYTSPVVIKTMWEAVERLGFTSGNILEPSMGVGNFFGLMPDTLKQSKLYGVELDGISAQIAAQLYPKADIQHKGYEETDFSDNSFDLAIGNIPFGNYKVFDPRYQKQNFSIHDYFFQKTLDKVRPGGVVAFITSKFTMDSKNPEVRKYIAERADLLGAVRLPNNAFLKNAGTETTMDILFLQKREQPRTVEPDWIHIGLTDDGVPANQYFLDNPDMILGKMGYDEHLNKKYGRNDYTACLPIEGANLSEQLKTALSQMNLSSMYSTVEQPNQELTDDGGIPASPLVKNYSYAVVNDKIYYRENHIMLPYKGRGDSELRCRGMIALRDKTRELIQAQLDSKPDETIEALQTQLNTLYDAFIEKHGYINTSDNKKAFGGDSSYYLLCSLESKDKEGNVTKADIFSKRTISANRIVTRVNTSAEALAVSIGETARVDMPFMRSLTGFTEEKIAADLKNVIFRDLGEFEPDIKAYKKTFADILSTHGEDKTKTAETRLMRDAQTQIRAEGVFNIESRPYVTADEYLSGNVRQKLLYAQALLAERPDLEHIVQPQIDALKMVLPTPLKAEEISVNLGATWIHKSIVQEFLNEKFYNSKNNNRHLHKVDYSEATDTWQVESSNSAWGCRIQATETYGTDKLNGLKILEQTLNQKIVSVKKEVTDLDGNTRKVTDPIETEKAKAKQNRLKQEFKEWIFAEPDRRNMLVKYYNEFYNNTRLREYNGEHITFSGINPELELKEHQKNAIARVLYNGNTLLAHEVGAGKTFEMVASAMELKRLGLCNKSLFVVPNHITEQTATEFLRLYPTANILVATEKDFEQSNRKKFTARISTGDYDAVIIGHSQFEKLPVSFERQKAFIEDEISSVKNYIQELKYNRSEKFTVKQLEKTKKNLEAKLNKLLESKQKDDVITFEELGVDRLFVDEAHYYKNLYLYTKMNNVAGISQTEAQKSSDLFMKCRYMDEITGGKGIIFATGTPVSNSMTELYTMQRYLQYESLKKRNMLCFDQWASNFGEAVSACEISVGNTYREKTRFAKFQNLPELMNMVNEFADIKTADTLNLPRPEAEFHTITAKPTEIQKGLVETLSIRAKNIMDGKVDPTEDNMLKVTSDGRKIGLDQRLIDENLPDNPESKVNLCTKNVLRIWHDTKADRLTQLVFCDFSTPGAGNEKKFNLYDDIKDKLVASGIPKEEIAFIHDADTKDKKQKLFDKVRSGEVRILFGSTPKMGSGTNVQDRLIALHDLDCPWRPAEVGQTLRTVAG